MKTSCCTFKTILKLIIIILIKISVIKYLKSTYNAHLYRINSDYSNLCNNFNNLLLELIN